jgi:hypothetical protein
MRWCLLDLRSLHKRSKHQQKDRQTGDSGPRRRIASIFTAFITFYMFQNP